jgi:hypothetical protein
LSAGSFWDVLGLTATRDQREIRRAYASRLKTIDQVTQADDFKLLRAAYEAALRLAQQEPQTQPLAPQATAATQPPYQVPQAAAAHSASIRPEVVDRNLEDMRSAFTALEASLHSQVPEPAVSGERLQALLTLPGWERLDLASSGEAELAELVARNAPRSDTLVQICIDRFHWRDNDLCHHANPIVREILQRNVDVQFLQQLRAGGSEFSDAYGRLTQPGPSTLRALWSRWSSAPRTDEIKLLSLLRDKHPNIIGSLDQEHVAWWKKFETQPQLPYGTTRFALGAAAMLMLYVVLSASGALPQPDTWHLNARDAGIAMAGLLALVPLQLGLVEWPTLWTLRRWNAEPPRILSLGWLPALLALMIAQIALVTLYPNLDNTPLLAVAVLLSALGTLWATWVSGPTPEFEWSKYNWLESSRLVQIVATNLPAFVLLTWIIIRHSPDAVPAYAIAAAATLVAPSLGRPRIARFWDGRVKPLLRIILICLALVITVAELRLLVLYDGSAPPTPVVVGAIVTGLVFQQIVTSRIIWKRPWSGIYYGMLLLIHPTDPITALEGRSGPSIGFMGLLVMVFTGLRLFGALHVEWEARQEGA